MKDDLKNKEENEGAKQSDFDKKYTIDEAIELTGNGIYQFKVFIIFGLVTMAFLMESTNMAYTLPLAKCDLTYTLREQAAINSIGFFAAIVTKYIWGFLSDTWGRKNVLMVSLIITFVASSISSLCSSLTTIMVARFCVGVGTAPFQPTATAYFSEFHCKKNRTKWLSKIGIFIASAFVVQPILTLACVTLGEVSLFSGLFVIKPWRLFLFLTSLIPLICFFMMLNVPESPTFLFSQGKYSETLVVLDKMHKINYRRSNMHKEYPVNSLIVLNECGQSDISKNSNNGWSHYMKSMWKHTKPLFLRPYLFDMFILCIITLVIYMGVYGFYMWFPYLVSIYQRNINSSLTICEAFTLKKIVIQTNLPIQTNLTQISMKAPVPIISVTPVVEVMSKICEPSINNFTFQISIVLSCIFLFFQIVIAIAIHKIGPKYVLLVGFILISVGLVLALFTRNFYVNIFLIKFSGISAGLCTMLYTISSDLFPTQNKVMAISFIGIIGRIAAAIGSSSVGPLLLNYCNTTMTAFATLIICCSAMTFYMLIRLEKCINKGCII